MEYMLALAMGGVGFLIAWLLMSNRLSAWKREAEAVEKQLMADKADAERRCSVAQETLRLRAEELQHVRNELEEQARLAAGRAVELATLRTNNGHLLEKLETRKKEIEELQKRLTIEFENIAGKILKERSDEFAVSNHRSLSEILNPLKEKIQLFEKKVDETYDKELRDKISLREEVRKLTELNTRVSEEANNLTRALKGDVKKQGNWGEVVLERVL